MTTVAWWCATFIDLLSQCRFCPPPLLGELGAAGNEAMRSIRVGDVGVQILVCVRYGLTALQLLRLSPLRLNSFCSSLQ
jgi:hypothetical protein